MRQLFLDIETYSSVDIKVCGSYKYIESPDFKILLVAYAFDDEPVKIVDVEIDGYPADFLQGMRDENTLKLAFNAQFERTCFRRIGMDIPIGTLSSAETKLTRGISVIVPSLVTTTATVECSPTTF